MSILTPKQAELAQQKHYQSKVNKTKELSQRRLDEAERQEIERDLKAMGLWNYSAGGEL